MRLVAVIVGLFAAAFIFVANSPTTYAQSEQPVKKSKKIVVVKSGDNLTKIAKKHKSSVKRIFYANKKVKNPDVIYPGQKLRIPNKQEKLKPRPFGQVNLVVNTAKASRQSYRPTSAPQVAPNYSGGSSVWDKLAACESGGNWSINTGNGYYGGLQFSLSSWRGVGGRGYPHQASKAEQIRRAEMLRASGGWGHWPACSAKLGLR